MPAVQTVLVIGAGLAGSTAAILLAEAGVDVDLVEIKPDAAAVGSGITLQGNALRVLKQAGVWEQAQAQGYSFDSLGIRAPNPDATLVAEIPDVRTGGPDLPGTAGMDRRVLARLLLDRAAEAGVKTRFGTTTTSLSADESGVSAEFSGESGVRAGFSDGSGVRASFSDGSGVRAGFSDGSSGRYDLVIGADGVRSWTRRALGIQLETRATGMGIWRVFGPRPQAVTRTELTYGGHCYIAGYCPTGENSQYAYLVENAQDRSSLTPAQQLETVRELAGHYGGAWNEIRASLVDPDQVNYTWFETHLLEAPWNRGRVVLIGDAAHCCPPTLAQGGAMALEDASVLAELLRDRTAVDDALWQEFTDRRFARAAAVVTASVEVGQIMLDHDQARQGDVPAMMGRIFALVSSPA